ncbi:DndE family protein [Prevotella sp.]|uniref:DndE family protein n=1 Tax=Prevotella sp. TaxID=59823 RepID=UPI002649084B|nr:DndE family protein [Prevotella sp.]MDN5554510.1 DndE family protein [Prevotella sp.]
MQINIKTSVKNQKVITDLTKKLPGDTKENVIARIALGYSLAQGRKFTRDEYELYDSQGKEYKDQILFDADYKEYYIALICQAYQINKANEDLAKLIKLHIDHGLILINKYFDEHEDSTIFDLLMIELNRGVGALENIDIPFDPAINTNQHIKKESFSGPINIKIGYDLVTGEDISFCFNNTKLYNNPHIAVAGKSGSGKTQFAQEFMSQLHDVTKNKTNFLFLDFKGIKEEDKRKMQDFFDSTETTFIDAPNVPFPLNPLSFIDNVNNKNKLIGINKFVDIIAKYANLGKKQQQTLKDSVVDAFNSKSNNEYPSLQEVNKILLDSVGDRRDSLTEIMERLSEYELFQSSVEDSCPFLNHNYYLSLSGDLDSSVRFTSVFLIINYIFNVFSNMGNAEVVEGYQSMRYVLMIDEAHDLFREKKSLEILEVILRKMRSYGVSVFLLSQGISEYNQGTFDFSQECETSFLLQINDLANTKAINKFLGLSEKESKSAIRNIEKLDNGYAISNVKKYPKANVFEVVQYWKEHQ